MVTERTRKHLQRILARRLTGSLSVRREHFLVEVRQDGELLAVLTADVWESIS